MELLSKSLRLCALILAIWTLVVNGGGVRTAVFDSGASWTEFAAWFGPMLLLAAVALLAPTVAAWLLGGGLVLLALVAWWVASSGDLMGEMAPSMAQTDALLALVAIPLVAVLGLNRPITAGIMLLAIAFAPTPAPGVGASATQAAAAAAVIDARAALAVAALLLLIAGAVIRRPHHKPTRSRVEGGYPPPTPARFASRVDPARARTRSW